jgi:hypothetical protein
MSEPTLIGRIVTDEDGTRYLQPLDKGDEQVQATLDHQRLLQELISAAYAYRDKPNAEGAVLLLTAAEALK